LTSLEKRVFDHVVDWLTDRFGDELKHRLALPAIGSCTAAVLLFWAASRGEYFSALLGLLALSPADVASDKLGLIQLPLYLYLASVVGSVCLYWTVRLVARAFFRYVCNLPEQRRFVDRMVGDQKNLPRSTTEQYLKTLRSAEDELERRRTNVRRLVATYEWLVMIGAALICASFVGNILDLACGLALLVVALIVLYRAVGRFISQVAPWFAKVEATRLALPA
jgi:hypothetical protein